MRPPGTAAAAPCGPAKSAGIRRGCVSVTNGWWASQGCAVNLTSEGVETDMAHGAAFHDNLVPVERAGGGR